MPPADRHHLAHRQRAIIPHVRPQPSGLGGAASGLQHRHWRMVGVLLPGGEHVTL